MSSMLASAGTKTIGLTIFNYQQGGDYNLAAAMSVLITILVVAGYCLLNRDHLTSVKQEENGYELHIQQVTKTFSKTQASRKLIWISEIRNLLLFWVHLAVEKLPFFVLLEAL